MENVLVIFGGKSVESDISVITAMQVLSHLPKGYNFVPVYIDKDNRWWRADNLDDPQTFVNFPANARRLRRCSLVAGENKICEVVHGKYKRPLSVACALVCCHGGDCEGGALQGMLRLCKIPFTCPDYQASTVCMDKVLTKLVLLQENIKNAPFVYFDYNRFAEDKKFYVNKIETNLGYPAIVKPARCGSSVGVLAVANRSQLNEAIKFAKGYDNKILVERYITPAKEYACAVMQVNGKILTSFVSEVGKGKVYTFEDKYLSDKQAEKGAGKNLQSQIKSLSQKVYSLLECKGVVRIDYLYNLSQKQLYLCEVNTIPGSLAFNLFKGVAFSDLIANLIEEAVLESKKQKDLTTNFTSDAIKHFIEIQKTSKFTK